ncbi:MAG: hypothetical protein BWZ02_01712 [Lentisphaerae bacterium ADurb.BinA184]|nr:MAG: hypothetical protein BWZ02_01712 [Lentisphaerae bacterium ADurb.BinA184]
MRPLRRCSHCSSTQSPRRMPVYKPIARRRRSSPSAAEQTFWSSSTSRLLRDSCSTWNLTTSANGFGRPARRHMTPAMVRSLLCRPAVRRRCSWRYLEYSLAISAVTSSRLTHSGCCCPAQPTNLAHAARFSSTLRGVSFLTAPRRDDDWLYGNWLQTSARGNRGRLWSLSCAICDSVSLRSKMTDFSLAVLSASEIGLMILSRSCSAFLMSPVCSETRTRRPAR